MSKLLQKTLPSLLALAGLGLSANVFAGTPGVGIITYGSGTSTPVPTLGGSALIVLAILLAVIAFRILRTQQHKGVNLVVALTAVTALASGVGGVRLVSDANAIPGGIVNMGSADGGTVQLLNGFNEVTNVTNVPLKILDINISPGCSISTPADIANGGAGNAVTTLGNGGGSVGECDDDPSTTVPPADYCTLIVFCAG